MKNLFLSFIALIALACFACSRHEAKDISDFNNPSATDSLLFYFTQMRACEEFWELAEKDTSLRNPKAREEFLKGFEKGFNAVKQENSAYNSGMRLGVRMAINLGLMERRYEADFDLDKVVPSMRFALSKDDHINKIKAQEKFYHIFNQIKGDQRDREHEKAKLSLIEEARHLHLSKLDDDLYYRITKQGDGRNLEYGQQAYVFVNYERADGVDIAIPSPGLVTIGAAGMPHVLNLAYSHLSKGASAIFATTAEAVFGTRTYIMDMKPEDVLVVTITVNEIVSPHTANHDSILNP